jgi:hypothetical protein
MIQDDILIRDHICHNELPDLLLYLSIAAIPSGDLAEFVAVDERHSLKVRIL